MRYINLDSTDENNRFIDNPDGFDNVGIYLDKGIVVILLENERVFNGIMKIHPSTLIVKNEYGYVLFYKTNRELKPFTDECINAGILATCCVEKGFVIFKRDGIKREYQGELTFDVLKPLPSILLLLKDDNVRELSNLNVDDRSDRLFSHLYSVITNYNNVNIQAVASFINNYVYEDPLDLSEVNTIVKNVNWQFKSHKEYKTLDEYEERELKWLYPGYIPLGGLTIVGADPGNGKTQFTSAIASIVSRGDNFPFSDEIKTKSSITEPSFVIMQNAEESIEEVIKPRLTKLNANYKNIAVINEEEELLTLDNIEKMEKVIKRLRPKLMIFDTAQRYMGNVNMNNMIEVTECLKKVTKLAQKYSFAAILVMHLNKSDKKDLYRIGGSVGFVGIARSVLLIENLKDSESEKVLIHIKCNVGKKGLPVVFEITDNGVVFKYRCNLEELNLEDNEKPKTTQKDNAKKLIIDTLSKGEIESQTLIDMALEKGISKSTLDRAKEELNIISFQKERKWISKLPDTQAFIGADESI